MTELSHKIDFYNLTPEQKLGILKEMGFREEGPPEHSASCTSRQGTGLVCTCLPGTTSFKAPADVRRYMGETPKAREEFAEKRWTYENDGIGKPPGLWVEHLEKTAPRWNT
ncbi:hypothetical protein [Streptomyces cucumeris]|uniref:hypothetical protein n=1 Tax=Streptomyces cucumeris TaxID=2962890 RepID=UPI0020C85AB6|nr:hypothetical protein [Streptomyces sp. NEAU-Y11]MCP9209605.1 hypothetical protein [Streptomyces sp. NEAU-Y11]